MSESNRASGSRGHGGKPALCLLLLIALFSAVAVPAAAASAGPLPTSLQAEERPTPTPPEEPEEPQEVEPVVAPSEATAEEAEQAAEEAIDEIDAELSAAEKEAAALADEESARERHRRERRSRVDKDTQVHFFSDLEIEENEVAREAVVILGALMVKGKVLGDTVSIMGPTYIEGEVTGTVTAVGDAVYLKSGAEVTGDVISVGSSVEMEPGARVLGEISELDFGPALHFSDVPWDWHEGWGFWSGAPLGLAWGAFWVLFRWVVLVLIATLVFLVARSTVERTARAASTEVWKAGLLGLATWLLYFPLMVVLTIVLVLSIIGIPLLIIVWPLGLFTLLIACLIGYTSVAYALGGWLGRRFGWTTSPWMALMIGIVAIQSLSLLARFFGSMGSVFWFFGVMFGLAGWLVRFSAWTVGLGAAILAFVEYRRGRNAPPAAPPPQSPPPGPVSPEPEATGDPVPDALAAPAPPPPPPPAPPPPPSPPVEAPPTPPASPQAPAPETGSADGAPGPEGPGPADPSA